MANKHTFIDVEKLKIETDNGMSIFEMILGELPGLVDPSQFEKTLNPFYDDKNPALSIYQPDPESWWRFHDFGEPEFSGDALDFAALRYRLDRKKDFRKLLSLIATDLKLNPGSLTVDIPMTESQLKRGFALNDEDSVDKVGIEMALTYFKQFGITEEILRLYRVRAITSAVSVSNDGDRMRVRISADELVIAYENDQHAKLYRPYSDKGFKFQFLGKKPKDFLFGLTQIASEPTGGAPRKRDILILTGGEKDVLTLASLGYDAISLNSETASVPLRHLSFIRSYKKVIVLYDIDETGKKQAAKLGSTKGYHICTLPEELAVRGGKDISDYVSLGLSIETLHELIDSCGERPQVDGAPANEPVKTPGSAQTESSTAFDAPDRIEADGSIGTPFIPDEVYANLPPTLKDICNRFPDKRDRDVIFLSCLAVLSSCLPNIRGYYDGVNVGCNFNLFISAPASAGKGIMSWSRNLGQKITKHLDSKYAKAMIAFEAEKEAYKRAKDSDKECEMPVEPVQQRLFIPANSSCSSIYEYLDANQLFGIIHDNEGDTLSSAMKNDWADFSSVLRKAFHHEPLSMARRQNREHREVEKPHLSVILSGTRNQVAKLIHSVENGLFSRFVFYDFDAEVQWKDMFGDGSNDLEQFFEHKAERILQLWIYGENAKQTIVQLEPDQITRAFDYFQERLTWLHSTYGEDIIGSVKRACLVYYRIAMILTAFHNYDMMNLKANKLDEKIMVPKAISSCALSIVDTLLVHLESVFTRLKGAVALDRLNEKQRALLQALPKSFSWQEFLAEANELQIGKPAAEKYRRDLLGANLIEKRSHGQYAKAS